MPHETDTVVSFPDQSGLSGDPLTTVAREGARQLIAQALEAELAELPEAHHTLRDDQGRQCAVRHGHLPTREIQTGIGPVSVSVPRVRDRAMCQRMTRPVFHPACCRLIFDVRN